MKGNGFSVTAHKLFRDRPEAGRLLAGELARRGAGDISGVLALARGGIAVGCAVAGYFEIPLEALVVRKISVPWQPELATGALAGDVRVLDEETIQSLEIPRQDVQRAIVRELAELKRQEALYQSGPPLNIREKAVVLVDDGMATGATMRAAIRHARNREPAKLIVAVPVGSAGACRVIRAQVDELVCLKTPEPFDAVSDFYQDFHQVTDKEVQDMLAESNA